GSLPVIYLGLPLLASKMSSMDCKVLLDKLTRRISSWMCNSLSFGGRLQLMASVLFSIQVFWCSTFILPVAVTKECDRIMRSFLWHGTGYGKKSGKVAWSRVCKPKKEGGLGFVGCRVFWAAKLNYNCSCSWRNVLKARNLLANYLHYEIGDGMSTSLWFDPWLSGVSLVDRYGESVIQESGLQRNARLSSVIKEGEWDWPINFPDFIDISNLTSGLSLSNTSDRIHWMKKGGTFTIRDTCNVINMQGSEVEWWKIAWFPGSIPKHCFCVWLTFEAHRTLDKLVRWGVVSTSNCCFGCGQEESIDHLFFSCPFTARV
ncbi:LOW QUALITY PROTEIN: zf-RVT domain-containing protein, partial [Cephalotus follicularis]